MKGQKRRPGLTGCTQGQASRFIVSVVLASCGALSAHLHTGGLKAQEKKKERKKKSAENFCLESRLSRPAYLVAFVCMTAADAAAATVPSGGAVPSFT